MKNVGALAVLLLIAVDRSVGFFLPPSFITRTSPSSASRYAALSSDENMGELIDIFVGFVSNRRSVLSRGAAATASVLLGDVDLAFAASEVDCLVGTGKIGEPVVSGGNLPLTVGLGTGPPYFQDDVEIAVDAGYRLFDTAQEYGSEAAIGNALKKAFSANKFKREDVFVTTKVDIDNMGYETTLTSVRESFDKLGKLDGGIDLVLIHWPCPFVRKDVPGAISKMTKLRKETWAALEQLQREGIAKKIGVSNFGKRHLTELLQYATVNPAVNQVECHPYNQRRELEKLTKSYGIQFEAYSPLGKGIIGLLEDPALTRIARTHDKSVAAVVLRWLLQRGITPIPLSRNANRIRENLNVLDFELTENDMGSIAKLDRGQFVLLDDDSLA